MRLFCLTEPCVHICEQSALFLVMLAGLATPSQLRLWHWFGETESCSCWSLVFASQALLVTGWLPTVLAGTQPGPSQAPIMQAWQGGGLWEKCPLPPCGHEAVLGGFSVTGRHLCLSCNWRKCHVGTFVNSCFRQFAVGSSDRFMDNR